MSHRIQTAIVVGVYASVLILLLRPASGGQHLVSAAGAAFAELAL